MNSQRQGLNMFGKSPGLARRVSAPSLVTRVRHATASALRNVGGFFYTVTNLRSELRRMADECEKTQPEQAARLRSVASSNWGE